MVPRRLLLSSIHWVSCLSVLVWGCALIWTRASHQVLILVQSFRWFLWCRGHVGALVVVRCSFHSLIGHGCVEISQWYVLRVVSGTRWLRTLSIGVAVPSSSWTWSRCCVLCRVDQDSWMMVGTEVHIPVCMRWLSEYRRLDWISHSFNGGREFSLLLPLWWWTGWGHCMQDNLDPGASVLSEEGTEWYKSGTNVVWIKWHHIPVSHYISDPFMSNNNIVN